MLYKNIEIYTNGQTDRHRNLLCVPAFVKAFAKAMELHSYLLLSLIIIINSERMKTLRFIKLYKITDMIKVLLQKLPVTCVVNLMIPIIKLLISTITRHPHLYSSPIYSGSLRTNSTASITLRY